LQPLMLLPDPLFIRRRPQFENRLAAHGRSRKPRQKPQQRLPLKRGEAFARFTRMGKHAVEGGEAAADHDVAGVPFEAEQGIGAYLLLGIFLLWQVRREIVASLRWRRSGRLLCCYLR